MELINTGIDHGSTIRSKLSGIKRNILADTEDTEGNCCIKFKLHNYNLKKIIKYILRTTNNFLKNRCKTIVFFIQHLKIIDFNFQPRIKKYTQLPDNKNKLE